MRPLAAITLSLLCSSCTDELSTTSQPVSSGWDARGDRGVGAVGRDGAPNCSGTLIAPRLVLTAAHCLSSELAVDFGDGPIAVVRQAAAPGFSAATLVDDLALLELARAPDGIQPVPVRRVALPALDDGTPVRIVGFGHTGADGAGELRRREGTTTLYGVDAHVIYTGPGPSQICHGDSGGAGLIVLDGEEVVAGVISTTDPSCRGWATLTRVDALWDEAVAPFAAGCAGGCAIADDGDGAIGAACAVDADCTTGFCDAGDDGVKVCTHRCTDEDGPGCGDGFACRPAAGGDEACFVAAPTPGGCAAGGAAGWPAALLALLLLAHVRSDRAGAPPPRRR